MDNALTKWSERDIVMGIERLMKQVFPEDGYVDPLTITHHFAKDVYIRECLIPKGILAVGKIHKFQVFNIILKGDVSVFSEQTGIVRYVAPLTFISTPGAKRVVYANEDTTWLTVHPTKKTNLVEIEEDIIAKDYSDPILVGTLKDILSLEAL